MNKNEIIKTLQTINMSAIHNIADIQQVITKLTTIIEILISNLSILENRINILNAQITNLERRVNKINSD